MLYSSSDEPGKLTFTAFFFKDILSDTSYSSCGHEQAVDNADHDGDDDPFVNDDNPLDMFSLNDIGLTVRQVSPCKRTPSPVKTNSPEYRAVMRQPAPVKPSLLSLITTQPLRAILDSSSIGDTAVEISQPPSTSIQLCEFEQPPRSTSTPINPLLGSPITSNLTATTPPKTPLRTPLNKRPNDYSTPLFRFQSHASSSPSGISCDEQERLFESFKSQSFDSASPCNLRLVKARENRAFHHMSERIRDSIVFDKSASRETRDSSMNRGIMKTPSSMKAGGLAKKVRINTTVELITPRKQTRRMSSCLSSSPGLPNVRQRKRAKKNIVDEQKQLVEYKLMMELCSKTKDPLDLLKR